jgi:hypothetical protein
MSVTNLRNATVPAKHEDKRYVYSEQKNLLGGLGGEHDSHRSIPSTLDLMRSKIHRGNIEVMHSRDEI